MSEPAAAIPATEHDDHAHEDHDKLYMKVLGGLTVLTILEIAWPELGLGRGLVLWGLGIMAAVKAGMVGLYYMHLKWEGKTIWTVMLFPIVLVGVMILGFVWDALGYHPQYIP